MRIPYEKMEALFETKRTNGHQVANALGYSQATFPRWKAGISVPKHDKIQEIADYFGVPVGYFYDDVEVPLEEMTVKHIAQSLRDDQRALLRSTADLTPQEVEMVSMFIDALKRKA